MLHTLVTRFGALGDLCVCGWFVAGLAAARPEARITLVTKDRFADLAARFEGVDRVIPLSPGGPGALWDLARRLRAEGFDRVIDAHGVLRSHLLSLLTGRRPDARIRKDTRARLALLRRGGGLAPPPPGLDRSLLDRFQDLAGALGDAAPIPRPPLRHRRPAEPSAARVALAPGARWPSKRWPLERFAELIERLDGPGGPEITVILGPDERALTETGPLAEVLRVRPGVEVLREAALCDVADTLARCRVAVTNDSGLLHLAEAVGTPVVALFGPTVRAFGYFPLLPESVVLEREIDCRPCSRTGSRDCRRGDLACLARIPVDEVRDALAPRIEGSAS